MIEYDICTDLPLQESKAFCITLMMGPTPSGSFFLTSSDIKRFLHLSPPSVLLHRTILFKSSFGYVPVPSFFRYILGQERMTGLSFTSAKVTVVVTVCCLEKSHPALSQSEGGPTVVCHTQQHRALRDLTDTDCTCLSARTPCCLTVHSRPSDDLLQISDQRTPRTRIAIVSNEYSLVMRSS